MLKDKPGGRSRPYDGTATMGVVLAAGRSRRFGAANKLLASFHGAPIASYAAGAMRAAPFSHRLAVVSDPAVADLFEDFEIVEAPPGLPQSESLHLGISNAIALGSERVVVALADMPLVTADLLAEIDRRSAIHGASASIDGGRRSPPAGFSRRHFDTLLNTTGDRGAATLLRDLPPAALVDAAGRLADIDTVADLVTLEASRK